MQGKDIAMEKEEDIWIPAGGRNTSVSKIDEKRLFIQIDGQNFNAILTEINRQDKTVTLLLNGKPATIQLKEPLDDLLHAMGLDKVDSAKVSNIKAPMPGLVLEVAVAAGDVVKKGDKLLVLEAMKMENVIKATGEGTVARILIDKGNTVDKGQTLIEFT